MKKTYEFKIQPQEVDFQFRATLATLTNILLTTAGFNADENGFGIRNLNQNDCSWVLLKLALEMDEFPLEYETIHVETWVEEVNRATTARNFLIKKANGQVIGKAYSNWAMIDVNTRRAQDLSGLDGIQQYATGEKIDIDKPVKLKAVAGEPVDVFKVKYSHIDINGHTNSMRYVEWISDCFPLETYKTKNVKRFEINFVSEILFGETVSIYLQELEKNDFRFELQKADKTACRARLVFSDVAL